MRRRAGQIARLLLLVALAGPAVAQNNELAVTAGGYIPVDPSSGVSLGRALALQGNFAHKIAGVPLVSAYLEIPVIGGFKTSVAGQIVTIPENPSISFVRNYTSLFVTPGLKLKIAPSFPISPYVVAGVGWARFKGSSTLAGGTTNPNETANKFAFGFGGGLDMKAAPFISFRAEVRDLYTGLPPLTNISLSSLGSRQHNIVPSLGIVLRF